MSDLLKRIADLAPKAIHETDKAKTVVAETKAELTDEQLAAVTAAGGTNFSGPSGGPGPGGIWAG